MADKRYCLDANVLIRPWNYYYAPELCPAYWDFLSEMGARGKIFIPQEVKIEIERKDDKLNDWLSNSKISVEVADEEVGNYVGEMFNYDPLHASLIDNTRGRSLADPWVIAHAKAADAVVVTKERPSKSRKRVNIPDVCQNMDIHCMDDFQMLRELQIQFSCEW